MELSPDITPEHLEVFLQEAEEQLELLDEEIVRLEREEDTAPLLQEIFRAAHTLKGSAGMIGHHQTESRFRMSVPPQANLLGASSGFRPFKSRAISSSGFPTTAKG